MTARTATVLVLCAASAMSVQSCGKKKPAPPPVVKPVEAPPPPPPVVSFDTISQEMQADARVQFAPDVQLEDVELARAVVGLCDAMARGDGSKMSRVLSKPAKQVVTTLEDSGELASASSGIEAVRVVYIGKNDGENGFKMGLDDINKLFSGEQKEGEAAELKIPPDVARQVGALFGRAQAQNANFDIKQFEPPMTAEKHQKIREAWEAMRNDPAQAAVVEQIQKLLEDSTSVPGLKDADYLVLVAVQSPGGVELTGWGAEKAFEKWTFNNASTDSKVKPRAADWDGVGIAGFSRDSREGAPVPKKAKPEGETGTEGDKGTGDETKKPEGEPGEQQKPPTEKRTPSGPVKIPGG